MKNNVHRGLIIAGLTALFALPANGTNITTCDCYDTKSLGVSDFIGDNNKITSQGLSCKSGYVMTGLEQKPEEDPKTLGQYVIISKATCCRLCAKD